MNLNSHLKHYYFSPKNKIKVRQAYHTRSPKAKSPVVSSAKKPILSTEEIIRKYSCHIPFKRESKALPYPMMDETPIKKKLENYRLGMRPKTMIRSLQMKKAEPLKTAEVSQSTKLRVPKLYFKNILNYQGKGEAVSRSQSPLSSVEHALNERGIHEKLHFYD